eukprot:Nitzschia sp. Nitz4//scaffold235_size30605//27448//30045//NITZ4_007982-RA/size30605-processed-gene-0.82-mRNA-1//-1//CDS//3329543474//9240//frame0
MTTAVEMAAPAVVSEDLKAKTPKRKPSYTVFQDKKYVDLDTHYEHPTPPTSPDEVPSPDGLATPQGLDALVQEASSGVHSYSSQVFTQTLGYLDDICLPKSEVTSPEAQPATLNEYTTDGEDSTLQSMQSTTIATSRLPSTLPTMEEIGEAAPPLVESPSQEHDNFEVVLEPSMLTGESEPLPKRKSWVRRLFGKKQERGSSVDSRPEPIPEPEIDDGLVQEEVAMPITFQEKIMEMEEEKKEDDGPFDAVPPVQFEVSHEQLEVTQEQLLEVGPDDEVTSSEQPVESKPETTEASRRPSLPWRGLARKIKSLRKKKEESMMAETKTAVTKEAALAGDDKAEEPTSETVAPKPVWKAAVDPNTGRTYWYHRETRESTFDAPPEELRVKPKPKSAAAGKKAKPLWKAVVDKNSGRTYYYHKKTRETTWTMPDELKKPVDETPAEAPTSTETAEAASPPMVVQAAVTQESQERITKGERGLLGASFEELDEAEEESVPADEEAVKLGPSKRSEIKRLLETLSPPDGDSVNGLLKDYEGREDVLLNQLREKVESQPFDEPLASPKVSPSRLAVRTNTYISKASAATKSSMQTERIKNTFRGPAIIEPICEAQSTATSISSGHGDRLLNPTSTPARVIQHAYGDSLGTPFHRERELKVEELTGSRVAAETFDINGRVVHSKGKVDIDDEGSYYGDNEVDTYGEDSVSALSEYDADFAHRRENFDQARRRALDDAIERKDWDLAAALTEGMRVSRAAGHYTNSLSQNASELDTFIANNDWTAVKSYIARMKEEQSEISIPDQEPVPATMGESIVRAPSRTGENKLSNPNPELSKRVGSRSQLQHKQIVSDSSFTSDSYDSEDDSYDSEYS